MTTTVEHLVGSQVPTHNLVPAYDYSEGPTALEIASGCGLTLDPWQVDFVTDAMGVRTNPTTGTRKWSAYEVAIELSRQNGKSVGAEVRTLHGMFVGAEKLIVYSAHKGDTAMEAFRRIDDLIASDPELKREVKQVKTGNGKESILLWDDTMVKFRTRTSGGGRGLAGDLVIIDEVQDANDDHLSALFPLMAARSLHGDPQIWYAGSAGDKRSIFLGRLVRRMEAELDRQGIGLPAEDWRLLMKRWAADLDVDDPGAIETWLKTNPGVGLRISIDHVESEYRALGGAANPMKFGRERLGVGDYPREEGEDWVIPRRRWELAEDLNSEMVGPVVFSLEVSWDRASASIGVAGWRPDRHIHLELIDREVGTVWSVARLKHLTASHDNLGVFIDPASPAASLLGPLRDAGVDVTLLKTLDLSQAFGSVYDGLTAEKPTHHHRGGTILTGAAAQAETRNLQGATTWKRAVSGEVAPLLAVTWAAHGLQTLDGKPAGVSRSESESNPGSGSTYGDGLNLATAQW